MPERGLCIKPNLVIIIYVCVCLSLYFSPCHSLKTAHFKCELLTSCKCSFPNGKGFDLSNLDLINTWYNASKDNLTFYYHPCSDISRGNKSEVNDCFTGASICLYNHTSLAYKSIGFANETSVTSEGLNNPVSFVYTHDSNITILNLFCDPDSGTSLEILSISNPKKYELRLRSPAACLRWMPALHEDPGEDERHLSTGSVLVIMFVVFSSLYFVGGALTLKLLRGAEGVEMIPNYDFWISLPGLVKEGFLFTISGCKPPQAYDRI